MVLILDCWLLQWRKRRLHAMKANAGFCCILFFTRRESRECVVCYVVLCFSVGVVSSAWHRNPQPAWFLETSLPFNWILYRESWKIACQLISTSQPQSGRIWAKILYSAHNNPEVNRGAEKGKLNHDRMSSLFAKNLEENVSAHGGVLFLSDGRLRSED